MNHGYMLQIIPKDPVYKPSPQQITHLIKFLVERLEIGGDWSVSGEDELDNQSAIDHLRAAVGSTSRGTEALVSFQDLRSGSPCRSDCDSPTPAGHYWA